MYHPDVPTGSAEKFRALTTAYDLLINSAPKERVEVKKRSKAAQTYFRFLSDSKTDHTVQCPEVTAGTRFYMMHNGKEFSVFFEEDRTLPFTIKVGYLTLKFIKG